jgi:hypothetical protein
VSRTCATDSLTQPSCVSGKRSSRGSVSVFALAGFDEYRVHREGEAPLVGLGFLDPLHVFRNGTWFAPTLISSSDNHMNQVFRPLINVGANQVPFRKT